MVPTLHCDFSDPGREGNRHTKCPLTSVVGIVVDTFGGCGTVVVVVEGGALVVVEVGTVVVVVEEVGTVLVVVVVVLVLVVTGVLGCFTTSGK